MTREEVIRGLEKIRVFFEGRFDMAVGDGKMLMGNWMRCAEEAARALREMEAVAPVLQPGGNYVCGNCGMYTVGFMHPLTGESVQTWMYCGSCGKKVKWE